MGESEAKKGVLMVKWLVAGLGNPGAKYEETRHNVGFLTVDVIAARLGVKMKKLKFSSVYNVSGDVMLLKPQTFMNLSGRAVRAAADFYKIPPEKVIIIQDDAALETGRLRLRQGGSEGGHNGIRDIIYQLNTDNFIRLKIGVGVKPGDEDLADWVLSGFSKADIPVMREAIDRAADAAMHIINHGLDNAMNIYNQKPKSGDKNVDDSGNGGKL